LEISLRQTFTLEDAGFSRNNVAPQPSRRIWIEEPGSASSNPLSKPRLSKKAVSLGKTTGNEENTTESIGASCFEGLCTGLEKEGNDGIRPWAKEKDAFWAGPLNLFEASEERKRVLDLEMEGFFGSLWGFFFGRFCFGFGLFVFMARRWGLANKFLFDTP
jgi:hypothetical protein